MVTSDVTIGYNGTLTVEPGTEVKVKPGVGITVNGTLKANGTPTQRIVFRRAPSNKTEKDFNGTLYYNPGVRLVDGETYSIGRVELFWNGQWGSVCKYWLRSWDADSTEVACRQLGFIGAKRFYTQPAKRRPIAMRLSHCSGTETSLWNCGYRRGSQTPDYCGK